MTVAEAGGESQLQNSDHCGLDGTVIQYGTEPQSPIRVLYLQLMILESNETGPTSSQMFPEEGSLHVQIGGG